MDRVDRKAEVRRLLKLSPQEVIDRAGRRLVVCDDLDALHEHFAQEIATEIRTRNADRLPTRLILPVGPTDQYPILADIVNREALSLENCWFFFMDEYCGDDGAAVTAEHPLSFKGVAKRVFLDRLRKGRGLRPEHVVFPDQNNIDDMEGAIEQAGGIDTCYGGIGIHGHVAFNEPAPGIDKSGPRRVELNDSTVTINAVRSNIGGNLECYPRRAYTLGMRQILSARRIRLYCRCGCEFDWANTVLRLALLAAPGDDYPVTYIRDHGDCVITTDRRTLSSPKNLI